MTEQEKRENTIYKMVIAMYGYLYTDLPSYYEIVKDIRSGRYSDLARLYDVGYREKEEVRKETASEIVNWLIECGEILIARNIAKVFGVEVKE